MQRSAFHKTQPVLPGASELTGGIAGALLRAPVVLFDAMVSWQHQSEERVRLRKMGDHQLRDIGLSRAEAEDMAKKAVWSRRI
jgi:uncharacterized protein YjiS (DUF1127 family)